MNIKAVGSPEDAGVQSRMRRMDTLAPFRSRMRAIRTTFGGSFCGSLVTVRKALVREMHDS
jgi:hypothetical protein